MSPSIPTPIVIPTANLDFSSSFGNCSNAAATCEEMCTCGETEHWRQNSLWYSMVTNTVVMQMVQLNYYTGKLFELSSLYLGLFYLMRNN
jgi:(2Fe-2S) ferredoxin